MVQLSRKFHFESKIHVAVLQPRCGRNPIGLGSSHFDRHYSGNHYCFLLLRVLRCFSSPGSLPDLHQDSRPSVGRVSPFGYLRIYRIFAPPRSFSQLVTSFIASESQGIHRVLLITFFVIVNINNYFFQDVKELFPPEGGLWIHSESNQIVDHRIRCWLWRIRESNP